MRRVLFGIFLICAAAPFFVLPCELAALQDFGVLVRWQQFVQDSARLPRTAQRTRLREMLQQNDRFAPAHAALARLLLDTGGRQNRLQAIRHIERAIALQPNTAAFHYLDGLICLQRDQLSHRTRAARLAFEKVLSLDPDHGAALLQLGLLAEQQYLAYRSVIVPHAEWTIPLRGFAEKELARAQAYLQRAASRLVDPAPAYYRLAFLDFEQGRLARMRQDIQRALAADSMQADYWLAAGLAYYFAGDGGAAGQAFRQARGRMPPAMAAVFDSVELVLSPAAARRLARLDAPARTDFRQAYWRLSDPLYLTAANERQLEHFARLAYANLRFSQPRKNLPGYRTDRGRTLIRYGFPAHVTGTRAGFRPPEVPSGAAPGFAPQRVLAALLPGPPLSEDDRPSGEQPALRDAGDQPVRSSYLRRQNRSETDPAPEMRREVWSYPGFQIPFEDRHMSGAFEFAWGIEGADGRDIFRRLIRVQPERADPVLPGRKMPLTVRPLFFAGRDSMSRVLLLAPLPGPAGGERFTVKQGFFLFDTNFQSLYRQTEVQTLRANPAGHPAALHLLADLPPGTYPYSYEVLDTTRGRVGVVRDRLVIPAFAGDTLQISDLLLARAISASPRPGALVLAGKQIDPAPDGAFAPGDSLHVYYELYQPHPRGRQTQYAVEMSLRSVPDQSGSTWQRLAGLLSSLWQRRSTSREVALRLVLAGQGGTQPMHHVVPLAGRETGVWQLKIRVRDAVSGQQVAKETRFSIVAE